jgi:transcriptional regulator with XRE-family HTH domain
MNKEYRSLEQYIRERTEALEETPTSLAVKLGWGQSYLTNVLNGQFRPSRDRCVKLAEIFGDDPNIILGLAGYYMPGKEAPEVDELASAIRSLAPEDQRTVRDFVAFLKDRKDKAALFE